MTDATSSARSGKFTKGQSGNPYGRPKKLKEPPAPDLAMQPSGWLALNESHRLQEVTINGVVQKRPVLDIATASIGKKAMQGSRLHYKILLDQTIEKEARIAERDKAFYKSMLEEKREGESLLREANEQGLPEPLILPHPDDIQFGPGSYEVRITGPSDESELAVYHAVVVYKKLAIWTTEDHLRRGAKPNIDVGTKKQYWLTILALLLNESSHPRFKLTLSELTKEAICARHASNKELDATIADFEHQLESLEKQFPPIPPVVTKAIEKIRRMMFSKTKHKTV